MEKPEIWLKRQISTIETELHELRFGAYNPHAHPGRARMLSTRLNRFRRELASIQQVKLFK